MIGRRKVLGLMAASPLAAKAAASELAGVSALGAITFPPDMLGSSLNAAPSSISAPDEPWAMKVVRFIAQNGIPEWRLEEFRQNARNVTQLDPDLATNCWSLSVKIQEQRERNFRRLKDGYVEMQKRSVDHELFNRKNGFWI
jgi:predicted lipoprotein